MELELAGKVAFVSGSGRGLGSFMARRLAEMGADVAVHDLSWTEPAKYGEATDLGVINPRSGVGDVLGMVDDRRIVIECKGGTINRTHAGQLSRLRRGLCEAVGLLMARPFDGAREIAAVPLTSETERLAARCQRAGIEIALVRRDGSIHWATEAGT
jgi:hypothetical protein